MILRLIREALAKLHPPTETYRERIVRVAQGEVGTLQVGGNNRGPRVEEYLASVGAKPGDPWCMAFAFWCCLQAALPKGTRVPRTGGAVRAFVRAQEREGLRWLYPDHPHINEVDLTGWVIIWARNPDRVATARNRRAPTEQHRFTSGHAGIVTSVDWTTGTISTIEGNTSPMRGFSADGAGVWEKQTTLNDPRIVGFFRPELAS